MKSDKTKIRNAATIIVVRNKHDKPSVLMGQRGVDAAFMPSKFVFPGGAVDDQDLSIDINDSINEVCKNRLLKENKNGSWNALVAAAIRELFEETGLVLKDAQCKAELRLVEQKGPQWLGFVYIAEADACSYTIHQTPEAEPFWMEIDQIPYHQMWPDDEIWLPAVLAKRDDSHILVYDFLLRGDELIDHQLQRNKTSSLMVD